VLHDPEGGQGAPNLPSAFLCRGDSHGSGSEIWSHLEIPEGFRLQLDTIPFSCADKRHPQCVQEKDHEFPGLDFPSGASPGRGKRRLQAHFCSRIFCFKVRTKAKGQKRCHTYRALPQVLRTSNIHPKVGIPSSKIIG